jgi:hypothetical protein
MDPNFSQKVASEAAHRCTRCQGECDPPHLGGILYLIKIVNRPNEIPVHDVETPSVLVLIIDVLNSSVSHQIIIIPAAWL